MEVVISNPAPIDKLYSQLEGSVSYLHHIGIVLIGLVILHNSGDHGDIGGFDCHFIEFSENLAVRESQAKATAVLFSILSILSATACKKEVFQVDSASQSLTGAISEVLAGVLSFPNCIADPIRRC